MGIKKEEALHLKRIFLKSVDRLLKSSLSVPISIILESLVNVSILRWCIVCIHPVRLNNRQKMIWIGDGESIICTATLKAHSVEARPV